MASHLQKPSHVDEPQQAQAYADVISRVASERQPVVVRRGGADVAAIITLEHLEILQDALAMQEAQRLLKTMDLRQLAKDNPPPQEWFDRDEPRPF